MKGVVFVEFLEFVERRHGTAVAERIAPRATTEFTPDGHYDDATLLALCDALSTATGTPRAALLRGFGEHLFGHFANLYPAFFVDAECALDFLGGIETRVHPEVQKLYPDARFPHFDCTRRTPDELVMAYRSPRPLADVAEGLIRGCAAHFGETIDVRRLGADAADAHAAQFVLVRTPRRG